jgi:hypothetical protein
MPDERPFDIAFMAIEKEFGETFGYIRHDLNSILESNLGLNYTLALLVCCACEMLAWHRDLKEDQVFTSFLPDSEPYRVVGKTLWEALRNGLAHKFRPDTIRIVDDEWRFSIHSLDGPHGSVTPIGHWIILNVREFAARVISEINAYEHELRTSTNARLSFSRQTRHYIRTLPAEAVRITSALKSLTE